MASVDDLDRAFEQYNLALGEFVKGNPEPVKKLFSHREDVTLANPLGPPARGWEQVAATIERAASEFRGGEFVGSERTLRRLAVLEVHTDALVDWPTVDVGADADELAAAFDRAEADWLLEDLLRDRAATALAWGEYAVLYRYHTTGQALEARLVPVANVRAALAAVENGSADAAFTYETDAASAHTARAALVISGGDAPRVVYPAAIVSAAPNRREAEALLAYLRRPAAAAVFRRYKFVPLEPGG